MTCSAILTKSIVNELIAAFVRLNWFDGAFFGEGGGHGVVDQRSSIPSTHVLVALQVVASDHVPFGTLSVHAVRKGDSSSCSSCITCNITLDASADVAYVAVLGIVDVDAA